MVQAHEMVKFNLNTATAHDFTILLRIEPSVANRIVQRRLDLGGFTSFDEVLDVGGVPPTKRRVLQDSFYIVTSPCCISL